MSEYELTATHVTFYCQKCQHPMVVAPASAMPSHCPKCGHGMFVTMTTSSNWPSSLAEALSDEFLQSVTGAIGTMPPSRVLDVLRELRDRQVQPLVDRLQTQLSVSEIGRQSLAAEVERLTPKAPIYKCGDCGTTDDEKHAKDCYTTMDFNGYTTMRADLARLQQEHAALTEERDYTLVRSAGLVRDLVIAQERERMAEAERDALKAAVQAAERLVNKIDDAAPTVRIHSDFLNREVADVIKALALLPAAPPTPRRETSMRVWVAEQGRYSNRGVVGVYSTAEQAMAAHPVTDKMRARAAHVKETADGWKERVGRWDNGCEWDDYICLTPHTLDRDAPPTPETE